MTSLAPARNQTIELHLPLVNKFASYMWRKIRGRVEFDELVSIGNVGLIIAIDSFQPSKGASLKTWITFRVRNAMIDYLRSLDILTRGERKTAGVNFQALHQLEDTHLTSQNPIAYEYTLVQELIKALNHYPATSERNRMAVKMKFLDEQTQQAIGEKLNLCPGAVSLIMSGEIRAIQKYIGLR